MVLVEERKTIPAYLISATIVFQLIRDGCKTFLANIIDTSKTSSRVIDVPIVKEFSNIFLD